MGETVFRSTGGCVATFVYTRNVFLFTDIRIVFQTIVRIITRKDVQQCRDAFRNTTGSILIKNDLSVPVVCPSGREES